MSLASRALLIGLIAGAILRGLVITSPGTPDVDTWKSWSAVAVSDPLGLYGVGGTPPERRLLRWGDIVGTTEYPPFGLYQLAVVGRAYRAIDPTFQDSVWLTVLIKAPGLLAESLLVLLLLTIGTRTIGSQPARWLAMAIWLNPALIVNGAALGYLDAQMAIPAAGAMIAVIAGSPAIAGVLIAIAVFTKPQALFVGPVLLLALTKQTRVDVRRALVRFSLAGASTAVLILLPIVLNGAWANMVQAISRMAAHNMLSGYAMNAWWVITWLVRSSYGAPVVGWYEAYTTPVRILQITRFVEVGYPNPKPMTALLAVALIGWGVWRYRRATDPATWAYVGGWTVFTYFLWSVQVHENHLYLAVPLLALAGALDARYRAAFYLVSALTALNMYLFYGLGPTMPSVIGRHWTVVDLSVFASLAACGVWLWLTIKPPVPVDRPVPCASSSR